MMAFFLLMWLIGSTTQGDLQGYRGVLSNAAEGCARRRLGSGDSSSVIQGGGQDLTRSAGRCKRADAPAKRQTINLQAARAELARREQEKLEDLKKRFEDAIAE